MKQKTLLVVLLAVIGCATQSKTTGPLAWVDKTPRVAETPQIVERAHEPVEPRQPARPGRIIQVKEAQVSELMALVNRNRFLLADRIEVDASRVPFQMAMIPVADPNFVETLRSSPEGSLTTSLILRSLVALPAVDRDYPRLRVGDGIDLVAGREIRIRTHSKVDPAKPVFLHARGTGHAIYQDEETGQRLERANGTILLALELVPGADGELVVRHTVR